MYECNLWCSWFESGAGMSGHLLQICALGAGGAAAAAAGARVCGGRMPTSPSLPAAVVVMLLELISLLFKIEKDLLPFV